MDAHTRRALGGVAREALKRARDDERLEPTGGSALALAAKAEAVLLGGVAARAGTLGVRERGAEELGAEVGCGGEGRGGVGAPGGDGALGLGGFAEEEAEDDVEAAEGEEEEGGDEGEVVDVVGEDGGSDPGVATLVVYFTALEKWDGLQALEDPEGAETKVGAEDGEEPLEEGDGELELREEEDNDLADDKETIDNSPEDASGLIWDSASSASWETSVYRAFEGRRKEHTRCTRSRQSCLRESYPLA